MTAETWQSPLRSFLFVPGTEEEKIRKVDKYGSDVTVLDLEDAVAFNKKAEARLMVRNAIEGGWVKGKLFSRINAIESGFMYDDIDTVVTKGLAGLQVPMIEDSETLWEIDGLVTKAEQREGMEVGSVRLLVRFETARGLAHCERILQSAPDRVLTCGVGLGDFTADLGLDFDIYSDQATAARCRVVVAARAANLVKPIDGAYVDLFEFEGLAADSQRSRAMGFQGRLAVHPKQVEVIKAAYSGLSEVERADAEAVVAAFEDAETRGIASIRVNGRLVDYPIYRQAVSKLEATRAQSLE